MSNQNIIRNNVRIPNLPMGRIVDENGMPTDDELLFRQSLLTLLQNTLGTEGLVAPSQTAANIVVIAGNQVTTQGANPPTNYTMAPGTILYDTTNNQLVVSILVGGVPTIKVFTVV